MINEQRLLETFLSLVRIDSPSLQEKPVADHLVGLLRSKGYEVTLDGAGKASGGNTGNIIAKVPGTGAGEPLGFSAHMDCVMPCIGVEPVVKDGVVTSASNTVLGGDDKAGIAAILEAVDHLHDEGITHPDLYLVFTICEESGMHGAKNLDTSLVKAKELIVLDSGGPTGTVVVQAPSKAGINITFTGKAAHAGMEPEKGISAIMIAAEAIGRMKLLRIDEETVANIGHIEGGGGTNIVTERVDLTAEARSFSDDGLKKQLDHMRSCCEEAAAKFGGSVEFDAKVSYPALQVPEDSVLLERARQACDRLGFTFDPQPCGGGSDANIFFGQGFSCINLGIGMSKVHTVDEFIKVEDIVNTAKLTAELMVR